ncbi:primase-helicase family protein [Citreimonas salinaria]|uniref:NrS-1 polymerase-like helicase domain-containing protein n=1 Tax=Citreimonas salinaria TaxID=321339 RepID=A0A1H3JRZ7_9RHOB|nr:primase-helicase family protein [Citreimonas salinaria]SDY42034.1 hypothetical protein SAMN05444340_107177 [Citreimonas salinaria]
MTNINHEHRREISRAIASWYVRKDNKYYRVEAPGTSISQPDVRQASYQRIRTKLPHIPLSPELLQEAFRVAFSLYPENADEAIRPWNGQVVSRPGDTRTLLIADGFATINRWREPDYRNLRVNHAEWGAAEELLRWMLPDAGTRRHVTDWIAWCLQNEADRPTWSLFLHSKAKGTGKSQLCRVLDALFGEGNTTSQNGITYLTGRFNASVVASKLVVCEEVKVKQGSSAANSLKTLISEPTILVEMKGQEAYQTDQRCCFVFTSNHVPLWLEADDRRYFIVDVEHQGHANGPLTAEFQRVVARVNEQIKNPASLAALYNAFMAHKPADGFNARSLNTETHSTPIMEMIRQSQQQVSTEQLEEYLNGREQHYIAQTDLHHYCQKTLHVNPETIRHRMLELGWHKVKVKWGGVDYGRVLWLRPGYSAQRGEVVGSDGTRQPVRDEVEIGL